MLIVIGVTAGSFLPAGREAVSGEKHSGPAFSLPRGPVLIIGLVGFAAIFAEASSADWSALYLVKVLGCEGGGRCAGLLVLRGAMTIARFTGDAVVRRYGAVVTTRVAGGIGTVGGLLVVLSWTPIVAIIGFVLIGIGIATVVPLAFSAAGHTATGGASSTNAIAGVATVSYGAGLAAPGVVGGIANVTSLTVSFGVVTVLILIVALSARALLPADAVSRSNGGKPAEPSSNPPSRPPDRTPPAALPHTPGPVDPDAGRSFAACPALKVGVSGGLGSATRRSCSRGHADQHEETGRGVEVVAV